eukprot:TRINITY_DN41512_c0_g1_i1.p1 TRINITY_DN41512_c0_g1~~TRINITY_DN41512_c0_g1_i1.p1  ORF type:complete len:422 (+),score=69.20 TRINITY_DN41512_c0_g1_i1:37-1302(+)
MSRRPLRNDSRSNGRAVDLRPREATKIQERSPLVRRGERNSNGEAYQEWPQSREDSRSRGGSWPSKQRCPRCEDDRSRRDDSRHRAAPEPQLQRPLRDDSRGRRPRVERREADEPRASRQKTSSETALERRDECASRGDRYGGRASDSGRREASRQEERRKKENVEPGKAAGESDSSIKPIWKCGGCGTSMFGTLTQCSKCGKLKPDADRRYVHVWNLPLDVVKKPLQWFQKKCGGANADCAPSSCQALSQAGVSAEEMPTIVLELKSVPHAEDLVAKVEKWKVGIPKMKAKVISKVDLDQMIDQSTTCLVFVKNVPEDIETTEDIKNMSKDIVKACIGEHPAHGRYAIIEAKDHAGAKTCAEVFNIPHASGRMTAELCVASRKAQILKESIKKSSPARKGSRSRRSRSRRRMSRSRRRRS